MRAVNCWNCQARIVLDDSFAGREIRCNKCLALVKISKTEPKPKTKPRSAARAKAK
jgi:hypothetical protein